MLRSSKEVVVGIVGVGVVGGAARAYFEQQGQSLALFDRNKGIGSTGAIDSADIIFMCVPTPFREGSGFDDSALENAVSELRGSKTVVIKSTVVPGTTERYQLRHPQHRFLFNPEFLREVSAVQDFREPDRQIVGYTQYSKTEAERVLALLPPAPYTRIVSARDAELCKYMANAFLALKVIYANEMYDLASALEVDFETVRDAVAADARIGASHLDVFDGGSRGYGGKCLPKDTKALLQLADGLGVSLRLLETADLVNALLHAQNDDLPRCSNEFVRVNGRKHSNETIAA